MKNVMILIAFVFIGKSLFAQDRNESFSEGFEKQIGLNATNFFLRFVSFNQGLENTPDILILYKKGTNGKKWRHGFGGKINLANSSNNNGQDQINGQIQLSYRFGREHYKNITKRWQSLFGWETHYRGSFSKSTNTSINSNGESTQENSIFNFATGIRALAGIQFRINDRLSLLTETSYVLSFSYRKSKSLTRVEGQAENQNENRSERYSADTFFNAPLSIILNFHF